MSYNISNNSVDLESSIRIELAPDTLEKEKYKFKLVVVGDSGVGKTNLIKRFMTDTFNIDSKATVGVEFMNKSYLINGQLFKVEIWDTAGQERYKSMTSAYYRGAMGALVVYDITDKKTFDNVEKWVGEIKQRANKNIKIGILGNKVDLEDEREVNTDIATKKAQQLNVGFLETSAFSSINVKKAFYQLLREMYKIVEPKIITGELDYQDIGGGSSIFTNSYRKELIDANAIRRSESMFGCC